MMQASLPMYDLPEIRQHTDVWWAGIAKHLRLQGLSDVPNLLQHDIPLRTLWANENLLLSQCCGFDVMNRYKDQLLVLMIPHYQATACLPGQYCSFVVVHEESHFDDLNSLRNSVAVINGPESHSGMNALFTSINPLSNHGQFFKEVNISGAHADSLQQVQSKQADVAAIDNVTYALLQRERPASLEGIRILTQTRSAPALPYVTSVDTPVETQRSMQMALKAALKDPELATIREPLLISSGTFPDLSGEAHPYLGNENPYRVIADEFRFDSRLLCPVSGGH